MKVALLFPVLLGFAGCAGSSTPPESRAPRSEAGVPASTLPSMTAEQLAERQWENRLLVVFAEEESDLRLDEQRRAIGPWIAELQRRDVLVVEVVGSDPLRQTLSVPPGGFHVLLVGKDGGVKLRSPAPVSPDRVITLIDSMPMGQQEARQRAQSPDSTSPPAPPAPPANP